MKLLLTLLLFAASSMFAQESAPAGDFNASAMLDSVMDGNGTGTAFADGESGETGQGDEGEDRVAEEAEGTEAEASNEGEGEGGEGEGTGEGEAEQEAEALEFGDEIGEPAIVDGPDGKKLYQWPEKAARAIQSQVKFASELQNAIPDLTVDDAIAHNEAYTDMYRLADDLRTGSADGLRRVGQMILNETGNTPAFANLTAVMFDHVKKTNPEAFARMSAVVEADLESELYQAAQDAMNHPDPNIREGYRIMAEMFSYFRNNGSFKPLAEYAKKIDPVDQRLQRAEKLERDHQQRVQAQAASQQKLWVSAANNSSGKGLKDAVEEATKPYAERFSKNPELKPMMVNHVIGQVREKMKADKEWAARFETQYRQALRERSQSSVQRIVDVYLARAKSILKRELPRMLSSASHAVVENSRQRHESLQRATGSSHRAPGGSGGQVKQSIAQRSKTFDTPEAYREHISALLS